MNVSPLRGATATATTGLPGQGIYQSHFRATVKLKMIRSINDYMDQNKAVQCGLIETKIRART